MTSRVTRGAAVRRLALPALMPAGAFAVHQLRYLLAFHSSAGVELQRQGHAYLHSLAPWVVLLVAVVVGVFLRALGRALGGDVSGARYATSFGLLWRASAACLGAIFICQELLEGLLASGHPAGLAAIFAFGGWWAFPAAALVGLVLAAALHGARWALAEVALRSARRAARAPECSPPRRTAVATVAPALAPLADGWSSRGPPR
jgi:hypothetical protein